MPTQDVVVVLLGGLDRLHAAGRDAVGRAPQRLPAIGIGVLRVEQDERHAGGRRKPTHLLDVALVAFLIQDQQRGLLRERARRDHAPRSGCLAGARGADQEDVLPLPDRQPRAPVAVLGH